jgi:hypothetical protein
LNYASAPAIFRYDYAAGTDLLTGNPLAKGTQVKVGAWDLVIAKEATP